MSLTRVAVLGAAALCGALAPAAPAQVLADKPPLHRPALVESSRAGADRFLVSVAPVTSRAAQAAQATAGCTIFSTSGTCGQEHGIALILYGATTASIETAATDAYDIVVNVLSGAIQDTEALQSYIIEGEEIVFKVAADLEADAIAKIASIVHLADSAAPPPVPAAPAAPPTPSGPAAPVLAPLAQPVVTTAGTVTLAPVAAGSASGPPAATGAAARPLGRVPVRLGAVGDAALAPVSRPVSRRLARLRDRGERVRLVQDLTYRVHLPGDANADLRFRLRSARTVRLGP